MNSVYIILDPITKHIILAHRRFTYLILVIFIVLQMVPHFVPMIQYLGHTQYIYNMLCRYIYILHVHKFEIFFVQRLQGFQGRKDILHQGLQAKMMVPVPSQLDLYVAGFPCKELKRRKLVM